MEPGIWRQRIWWTVLKIKLEYEIPKVLAPIYKPHRYKSLRGGRGGSKSWGVARALLDLGTRRPLRILCAREFQKSIADSVHRLLSDQIDKLNLHKFYDIQQRYIKGVNGTIFGFEGVKHNVNNVRSWEGADICWVEEAHSVSDSSWKVLIPTIRSEEGPFEDGASEIWLTWNPDLETDATYRRFVLEENPDVLDLQVSFRDNPFFPEVLRREMEHLKATNYDEYLHVWEGQCRQMLEGAIYAQQMRKAQEEGRITAVPYDASKPVSVFFDLGWADKTSIWFAQAIGFEYRIIDFYENRQESIQHYLQIMQNKGYLYDQVWLPHDAASKALGTGRSIEELVRAAGYSVMVLPRTDVNHGINAARTIFSQCYFDEAKCADGLQALRHYRYEIDEDGKWSTKPLHDEYSHAADAFRYLAMALTERRVKPQSNRPRVAGWMR